MPIPIVGQILGDGIESIPWAMPLIRRVLPVLPWLAVLYLVKWYCSGTSNTSERTMHGKVVLVTVSPNPVYFSTHLQYPAVGMPADSP